MKKLLIGLILVMLLVPVSCTAPRPAGPPEPPVPPTTPEPITVEPEKDSLPIDLDVSDYPEYLDLSISIESLQNQEHFDAVMNGAVGDELTVTLGSNPSTGFSWFAEISNETIVQQTSQMYFDTSTETPPIPSSPGEEVWTFKALKAGTTTISMEYSRPWEEEDIGQWTVTITANIR